MSDWPVKDPFGNEIHLPPMDEVIRHGFEIFDLLLLIAPFMVDGMEPEDWVAGCFVSDLSSMGDFCLEPEALETIGKRSGFAIKDEDLLVEIMKRSEHR